MDNRTTDQATNTFFKTNVSKFQDQHFQDQHFQDQHFQDQHFQDQPFPHDIANMSTMENSPEDIKHLVVENISDIRTFESIVDASPTFKTLYNSKPKYFLTKLNDRAVHNNIQREALIALQSSMTMDIGKARRPKMIEFLHTRYGSHEPSPLFSDPIIELPPLIPKNIDMAALNLISELHRTVQFLTADFCSYIEESQVDNKSPQIRFSLPLSESETCRIQRAFYRIEIFSNLFWKKTCKTEERFYIDSNKVSWVRCRDPGKPVNRWEKRGDHVSLKSKDLVAFCESFPAWENEEIACIREYMRAKIAKCFATVASDYAKVVRRRKMEPDSGGSIFWDFDLSPEENLKDDGKSAYRPKNVVISANFFNSYRRRILHRQPNHTGPRPLQKAHQKYGQARVNTFDHQESRHFYRVQWTSCCLRSQTISGCPRHVDWDNFVR
jgi:hypothetical protein